jgi:tRNA 2-selenouridine synthase
MKQIPLSEWLHKQSQDIVALDARSPGEYAQGHVPGALNLPLLNNEERHLVGLCYKEKGHDEAVKLGFELTGHQFIDKIKRAEELCPDKKLIVYCWRGGLRSQILSWILSTAGFDVHVLEGGYKSYRQEAIHSFALSRRILIVSGKTGAGKTEILHALRERGEQILDIEGIGTHKGSSFGGLGQEEQAPQEHFENRLASALMKSDPNRILWIEDESRFLGKLRIPDPLYHQMFQSELIFVDRSRTGRTERILNEYGSFPKEILAERTLAVSKRMGNEQARSAVEALMNGDFQTWVQLLLDYYDKGYAHSLAREKRTIIAEFICDREKGDQLAPTILEKVNR